MPVQRCTVDGKSGWRWGESGKCYTGPDAKEKALEQGRAIKANEDAEGTPLCLVSNLSSYSVRLTKFENRDHIVVPVVMLTEGVHNGSGGALYYPAEEISKFPAAWDGRPVPVLHPQDDDGTPISCNSPDVLEGRNVGRVFNTRFAGGKLTAQLWLDVAKLEEVDKELLQRINAREPIEVSTGLFLEVENQSGEWNGEKYDGIARDFRPDHLALLPIGAGACSLKDGCGIRVNTAPLDFQQMWQRLVSNAAPSFGQISNLIQSALRAKRPSPDANPGEGSYFWLEEVWPEHFIYTEESPKKTSYYKQSYKLNEDQTDVIFEGQKIPVKLERTYVEITKNEGGNNVDKKEKIKFLIDNGCQCNAEQLDKVEDAVLDNMAKTIQNQLAANKETADKLAANEVKTKELEAEIAKLKEAKPTDNQQQTPKTLEELVALASPELQGALNRAVARDRKLKADLVDQLAANQKAFTKEELEGKTLEELEKLAALAQTKGDFTLAGGAVNHQVVKEEPLVAPTFNFGK
jgi:hypothetical protein